MARKKKQYISLDGLAFNPKGWTKAQEEQYFNKLVELAESFGAEIQYTGSVRRQTEEDVLAEE